MKFEKIIPSLKVCLTCKKEYYPRKSTQKFCSYICRNKNPDWKKNLKGKKSHLGDKNPKWKGGTSIGYQLRICKEVLVKDNRDLTHCEKCTKEGEIKRGEGGLDIHHKDKNRNNNIASNLMVVCRKCHYALHHNHKHYVVKCHNCTKEFTIIESVFKRSIVYYCTKQCYYKMVGKFDYRKKVRVGGLVW